MRVENCFRKKLQSWAPLITLLVIASVATIGTVKASPYTTKVYVDPQQVKGISVSGTFAVDVNVTDVTNLNAFEILLNYETSILNYNSATEGPFLKTGGTTRFVVINVESLGRIMILGFLNSSDQDHVDGSGVLVTINFTVTGNGATDLDIGEWSSDAYQPHNWLINTTKNLIPHDSASGFFSNIANDPPVASFTFTPTAPNVSQTVTFNATASSDPDGTIASYKWDFGDLTVVTETDPITTHAYADAGNYTVTLTVTDNGTIPITDTTQADVTVSSLLHDIAITTITLAETKVIVGDFALVDVTVENQGTQDETSINVTVSYNTTFIDTQTINLTVGETKTLTFKWDTTSIAPGAYTIKAEATVDTDDDPSDDTKTTTILLVEHSIAVTSIDAPANVTAGEIASIMVSVENKGGFNETFSLKLSYNTTVIENRTVTVAQGYWTGETFLWNTAGVAASQYTITAEAILAGDDDLTDNTKSAILLIKKGSVTLSISVSPLNVTLGESTIVNGSVETQNPVEGKNITIQYRLVGEENWNNITTVTVDANGEYSYDWMPEAVGNYEVRVTWPGDQSTRSSESEVKAVNVKEAPSPSTILYVAIATIIVVILIATAFYVIKIRKPKPA